MAKRKNDGKGDGDAAGQAPNGSSVLRRMRLSDLFSGRDKDRKAFEKFLEPETETDS